MPHDTAHDAKAEATHVERKLPPEIPEDRLDPDAVKVVRRLRRAGFTAYLVGGCVRDLLLGMRPKDFDVATSAHPNQVKETFRNSRLIGRRFRLAHVFFRGGKIIEVSTFRANPLDEVADLPQDLLIRHDNVFGNAEEDARRRDFTINALFYDVDEGRVVDHVGGRGDLRGRLVRTIGNPDVRMREDPIRILRAIRFAAKCGLRIEPDTLAAMKKHVAEIPRCAPPRVLEEVLKLLRSGASRTDPAAGSPPGPGPAGARGGGSRGGSARATARGSRRAGRGAVRALPRAGRNRRGGSSPRAAPRRRPARRGAARRPPRAHRDAGLLGGRRAARAVVAAAGRGGAGDRAGRDGPDGPAASPHRRARQARPGGPAAALGGAQEAPLLPAGVRAAEHLPRGAGGLRAVGRGDRPRRGPAAEVAGDLRRPGFLPARARHRSPPPWPVRLRISRPAPPPPPPRRPQPLPPPLPQNPRLKQSAVGLKDQRGDAELLFRTAHGPPASARFEEEPNPPRLSVSAFSCLPGFAPTAATAAGLWERARC